VNVGFIGLGSMGTPMARNVARGGDDVLVFDIDPRAVQRLDCSTVRGGAHPAEIASKCELVFVMVWDDAALREVVFGEQGVLAAEGFRGCLVDLSTTSVAIAQEIGQALNAHGAAFLDGAVIGGGVPAAVAGRSPIVLSGVKSAFERYRPVVERLGECEFVGEQGAAKAVKIINNLLVGVMTAANAEALSLGVEAGLGLQAMVEGLGSGPAASHVLASYMGRYVTENRYGDGLIGHALMAKDLSLACELARQVEVPALFAEVGQQMYVSFARTLGAGRPFPSAFEHFRQSARPNTQP
jgi:3-hydroxyisobutyrate dehydrogenase-like beta-hydroxyacid dehydrogenase